jgi:hypothetical protein
VETLAVAATRAVATPPSSLDLGPAVSALPDEPEVRRWPGWACLAILFGGSAALWAAIAWAAIRILKLG